MNRREIVQDEILLGVLDIVEKDAAITQRSVASELGIAVGLANTYLKRCVRKGLIRVGQIPARRYSYYLTPQGFAEKSRLTASYLSHSFAFFRRARSQCAEVFAAVVARGHRRLALVGDGDLAEIARLLAREYPLEIVGVLPAGAAAETLKAEAARFGKVDAVVITAMVAPRESYDAAVAAFGAGHVHAPALLRLVPGKAEGQT